MNNLLTNKQNNLKNSYLNPKNIVKSIFKKENNILIKLIEWYSTSLEKKLTEIKKNQATNIKTETKKKTWFGYEQKKKKETNKYNKNLIKEENIKIRSEKIEVLKKFKEQIETSFNYFISQQKNIMIIFIVIVSDIIKDFEYLYSLSYCIDIHEKINIEDTLSVRSNNIKYIENRALLGLSTQHFNNIMENRSISSNLKRFAEEAYDIDREMYRKYFCHGIYHTYWEHYAGNNLRERREILKSKKSNISLDSKFDKNLFNQEENIIMSICRKEPNIFKQYNQIIRIENININTLSNLSEKLIEYLCDVAFNYAKIIKDKFKFFSEHSINMLETWKNEFITAYI